MTDLPLSTLLLIVAAVGAPMLLGWLAALAAELRHEIAVHTLKIEVANLRIRTLRKALMLDDGESDVIVLDTPETSRRAA